MMNRFEELEYLADFVPEEGESVVVTRRHGELVCEPCRPGAVEETSQDFDPAMYGRLVQSNERLNAVGTFPIFACVTAWFWLCVATHLLTGMGWSAWFLDTGFALTAVFGCHAWIRHRQSQLFRTEIRPVVARIAYERGMDHYTVIGAMRQRPELRTLLDDMARWVD